MRVLDPDISEDDRAKIQHTMLGAGVLDAEHFPEISYHSTAITKSGDAHWEVRGNLRPAWKKSTGCGSGFFRERASSRLGIFQTEHFRNKPHTHRRGNRKG